MLTVSIMEGLEDKGQKDECRTKMKVYEKSLIGTMMLQIKENTF